MTDDAGAVNAAIHKADEPAAAEAMKKLSQSCEIATPCSISRAKQGEQQ